MPLLYLWTSKHLRTRQVFIDYHVAVTTTSKVHANTLPIRCKAQTQLQKSLLLINVADNMNTFPDYHVSMTDATMNLNHILLRGTKLDTVATTNDPIAAKASDVGSREQDSGRRHGPVADTSD